MPTGAAGKPPTEDPGRELTIENLGPRSPKEEKHSDRAGLAVCFVKPFCHEAKVPVGSPFALHQDYGGRRDSRQTSHPVQRPCQRRSGNRHRVAALHQEWPEVQVPPEQHWGGFGFRRLREGL